MNIVRLCQLQIGDYINFQVHISNNNTPQVSAPVWIRAVQGGRVKPPPGSLPQKAGKVGENFGGQY
jgi:hypothetical protein